MHPQLEHLANQAHVDDLRREAERQRREARLLGRSARRSARPEGSAGVLLSPAVRDVLVVAEHRPTRREVELVVEHLRGLGHHVVTALLHHRPSAGELVNEAGSHSLSLPTPAARIPAQRAPSEAEQHLSGVVDALRTAGHDTTGELISGPLSRVLAQEVRVRRPEAVILLADRHRLARLAGRDPGRQLQRRTQVPVISVTQGREPRPV
jgi:hypothetical protein